MTFGRPSLPRGEIVLTVSAISTFPREIQPPAVFTSYVCTTSVSRAASRPGCYVERRLVLALRKARKGGTLLFESKYPCIIATASTTTTPSFVSLISASSSIRRFTVHLARTIADSRPFRYPLPQLNKPHTTTAQNRAYLHVRPSAPPPRRRVSRPVQFQSTV